MPDRELPPAAVLEALGFALFLRAETGSLRAVGRSPEWLRQLWPGLDDSASELPIAEASPFFENFLIDAEDCWRKGAEQRVRSGPWIEEKGAGEQVQLEATALTVDGQSLLLVQRLSEEFEAKKEMLQRARETVIAHQRLNSEIQKKEILLHYVADEMTAALANVITSLRLIELEDNPPRTKLLLGLATRGTEEQQTLINRVLAVFADEIGAIFGEEGAVASGAEWSSVLQKSLEMVQPQFSEKGVQLNHPPARGASVKIPTDPAHLQRVVIGFLENALERTPAGGNVILDFEEDPEAVVFRVTDGGERLSVAASENMFSRFELPAGGVPASALRLHFCRIIVESCGGEIGYTLGQAGENTFWFRLPKRIAG
ncbi:MAG TPA: HAMP domain-containing sensor histidine kinase [Chthoniobacterales bacterium]|nr:HAMP domain-containing sensor histidine kinase [Chthoniobacterales bacterium]